jgi:DNA-binding transcriptional LysR family regulator
VYEVVELREIRVFLTLADELHFGRTANRLGLTQSRVSQSLRTLEQKLGEQLMHRTSRQVRLTPAGEVFRSEIEPSFAQLTTTLERATRHDVSGTLRIGMLYPNSGGDSLLSIIDAFESRHPRCEVQVTAIPSDDPSRPLKRAEVDLIALPMLRDPIEGYVAVAVFDVEPRVVAVARNHPLASRSQVEIEDLGEYQVVAPKILPDDEQETFIPYHTPSGRPIERYPHRPSTTDEIAMLVARGKVVYPTVPATSAYFGPPNIVSIPLVDMPPVRKVLLTLKRLWNPRLREFARVAREVAEGPTA